MLWAGRSRLVDRRPSRPVPPSSIRIGPQMVPAGARRFGGRAPSDHLSPGVCNLPSCVDDLVVNLLGMQSLCWYCGRDDRPVTSPEHVIPRSLGGGLVVRVCSACNARANQKLDQALARCRHFGRARAEAGVRDYRSGEPYTHVDIVKSDNGITAQARFREGGVDARLLPIELKGADGVTEVFLDPADANHYDETQRARAAREGFTYGPSRPLPTGMTPRYRPGSDITLVMTGGRCDHPPWMWPSLAAKAALGALACAAAAGHAPRAATSLVVAGLRLLAFERWIPTDLWSEQDVSLSPVSIDQTHPLVGALQPHNHLLALQPRDQAGRTPFVQLVLFGQYLYELRLPGLELACETTWLFDARARTVSYAETEATRTQLAGRSGQGQQVLPILTAT